VESPSRALEDRGVEYVEVRSLDLNPFDPIGINEDCIRFFDTLLVFGLLSDSPQLSVDEYKETVENRQRAVMTGRKPGLSLCIQGKELPLDQAGIELIDTLEPVAALLDQAHGGKRYAASLERQRAKLQDSALTPSARILSAMDEDKISFYHFAMVQACEHADYFKGLKMDKGTLAQYQAEATESLIKQQRLEDSDTLDFDAFLANYFSRQNA